MRGSEQTSPSIPTTRKVADIASALLDKKAGELVAFDLSGQNAPTEAMVILTATSTRHGQGLADHLLDYCRERGMEFLGMEGYATGQWILLDLNDVVVHVLQTETRDLFRLEDLWPSAPVLVDQRVSSTV